MSEKIAILFSVALFLMSGIAFVSQNNTSSTHNIVIAILDTGIEKKYIAGIHLVEGINILDPQLPPKDDHGHGTEVASIIHQLNSNIEIMPIKVISRSGLAKQEDMADGIRWAVDHGAKIINISAGVEKSTEALKNAILYAAQEQVTVVAASGRTGEMNAVDYPAVFDSVIAVGAIDENCQRLNTSNTGKGLDFVALADDIEVIGLNGEHFHESGTSLAVPFVVGDIANLLTKNPDFKPEDIRAALKSEAQDLNEKGWDKETGYGLVGKKCDRVI